MSISVIVPVFNGERTIEETIKSILNQTFSNIEIIIINDGSTDTTLEILENIYDSRIKIFSYPNAGLSVSRNRGISQAKGEYISFIDADDLWTADKLELQWQVLQSNSQAAVAYSWTDYIDESGKFIKSGRRIKVNGDAFRKLLITNFLENGSNPLIRQQALEKVGGFDESLAAAEDKDMWLRLAANYEFVCVEKPQILYRTSTNSMSTNLKRQETASLKVIERGFSYPQAEKLQHLKKQSLSHLYQYLTFKAIEAPAQQRQTVIALYFWWNWMINNSTIIKNKRLIIIAVLKIIFLM
ncbi:MAG: glycosyltransferase [Richelia sp. RM2_1_2]|nr:glycosyltransferase [Richelia sp. SM2_1_7]NJM20412.1 glycosyltransferase [Richelia sp. SM1_7_0]NJN09778.1 glycosyltransferase [Richelia sp. RM1_1_1]NJO28706.1 glycosyltransferase [Richelia sp. SL_2_1]NJO62502.1 glycosyltransferase [Richelia sp. RM2_1_2]